MSELSIEARVQAGAAYLDQHYPGWVDRIAVAELDISSPCRCILGQLLGEYPHSGELTGEDRTDMETVGAGRLAMGFEVDGVRRPNEPFDDLHARIDAEYARLTDEWARVITARRAEVTADA